MKPFPISITVSDPWELGESQGWDPLLGSVVDSTDAYEGGRALIHLRRPLSHKNATCQYLIAAPRHENVNIGGLFTGTPVFCALTGITDQEAASEAPFNLRSWGGRVNFIGEVNPAS